MRKRISAGAIVFLLCLVIIQILPVSGHGSTVNFVFSGVTCNFSGPWTRDLNNPIKTSAGVNLQMVDYVSDPCVIYDSALAKYKMWFESMNEFNDIGIAYADSVDGITWSVWQDSDPTKQDLVIDLVLNPDPNGWDKGGVKSPCVVQKSDGTYQMYYTGQQGIRINTQIYYIGLATSSDGIAWTKHNGDGLVFQSVYDWETPFVNQAGDKTGGVSDPFVILDSGGYTMWYGARGKLSDVAGYRLGRATSTDGITWNHDQ
ncbi:MAG: hypothetical protein HY606_02165 [Planctomycetes bacterium]|nr:hypothetical protein [Planctomycetota bacterium]